MTVTTTNSRISYTGDGVSTVFPFPYYFLLPTDIKPYVSGAQLLNGFTVVGAGSTSGGYVTITPAPAAGAPILLLRDPDTLQQTAFPPNDPFPSSATEKGFDKLTMILQRVVDRLSRALQTADTDTTALLGPIPSATARAGMVLGFDPLGQLIMLPQTSSIGAGDMRVDTFVGGVDFVAGTTTQLTLSRAPGNPANLEIFFDGGFQGPDQWALNGSVVTFTGAIPAGVAKVFARSGTTLSTSVPPAGSVGESQIAWGTILNRLVDSITELRNLNGTTHSRAFVLGYSGPGTPGGGPFYADYADTTSADNGGTIIVGIDGTRFKRPPRGYATLCEFGCAGDGVTDDSARAQVAIDAMKGKRIDRDIGKTFLVAGLTMIGASYNNTTIGGTGLFKLKPDGGASTFSGAWVGLLIKDCDGVTVYDNWDGNRSAMTQREQIFCTGIAGASNVRVKDPTYVETRGDCIYIGQSNWQASSANPQNIQIGDIRHVNSAVDGRNTVSIIAVSGLRIASCMARNSGGTVNGNIQPGGIDIEPDFGYETCTDIDIGPCDITTGGTAGLGVFGKSISGNDANLDWNCFDIRIAPSRVSKIGTSGAALSAGPFTRVGDLFIGDLYVSYDGGVRGRGPVFDYCNRVTAKVRANNVTIGALLGSSASAADSKFDISAGNFDTAIVRSTSVTNSTIDVRRAGTAITASTSFGVQLYNEGRSVTQQDVTYRVHCPYDGVMSRAFRNEPGSLVTIGAGCQVDGGDWTGYSTANDASIPTRDVKGWNDQSAVPSTGSWVLGDFVRNTVPAQSAGKIIFGWSRLNTGSNNVLNADWSQVVATIS